MSEIISKYIPILIELRQDIEKLHPIMYRDKQTEDVINKFDKIMTKIVYCRINNIEYSPMLGTELGSLFFSIVIAAGKNSKNPLKETELLLKKHGDEVRKIHPSYPKELVTVITPIDEAIVSPELHDLFMKMSEERKEALKEFEG